MSYSHISVSQIIAGSKTLAPQMNQNFAAIVDRVNALSDTANDLTTAQSGTTALLTNVAGREQQIADQLGGTTTGTDPNKVLAFQSGSPTRLRTLRTFYWFYEFALTPTYPQPVYRLESDRTLYGAGFGYINMGGAPTNSGAVVKLQKKAVGGSTWTDLTGFSITIKNSDTQEAFVPASPVPANIALSQGELIRCVVVSESTGAVLPHDITVVATTSDIVRNL